MHPPVTAVLPPDLQAVRDQWLQASPQEQEAIYAQDFAPAFLPLFAQLPLHGWPGPRPQVQALISVLGLSWQPVVLMAAWMRPSRLLLLGTRESVGLKVNGEPVLDLIFRLSGLSRDAVTERLIEEPEELGIYEEISRFLKRHRLGAHEVAIDPTGGKKSMAASATLAGFLTGAWIVYVDYLEYHPVKRIPVAGTEYPRLLQNPLEVFGHLEFQRARDAYRRGNYDEAVHLADALADRLYDPREAQALAMLYRAYGTWQGFQFDAAAGGLQDLGRHLERFGSRGKWSWAVPLLPTVRDQAYLTARLAELTARCCRQEPPADLAEGFPLVLNHLAAAQRALAHKHLDAAVLLVYATLERHLNLCLWAFYGLDDERPDFSGLPLDPAAFHGNGRRLHGKHYREQSLQGPLTLSLAVQLLATLRPDLLPENFLLPIKGLMTLRNKSQYEHGLCPTAVKEADVKKHLDKVKAIIALAASHCGLDLDRELTRYGFPQL